MSAHTVSRQLPGHRWSVLGSSSSSLVSHRLSSGHCGQSSAPPPLVLAGQSSAPSGQLRLCLQPQLPLVTVVSPRLPWSSLVSPRLPWSLWSIIASLWSTSALFSTSAPSGHLWSVLGSPWSSLVSHRLPWSSLVSHRLPSGYLWSVIGWSIRRIRYQCAIGNLVLLI